MRGRRRFGLCPDFRNCTEQVRRLLARRARGRTIRADAVSRMIAAFWRNSGRTAQLAMVALVLSVAFSATFLLGYWLNPPPAGSYEAGSGLAAFVAGLPVFVLVIPQIVVGLALRSWHRKTQIIGAVLAAVGGIGMLIYVVALEVSMLAAGVETAWQWPALLMFGTLGAIGVLDMIAAYFGAIGGPRHAPARQRPDAHTSNAREDSRDTGWRLRGKA